MKRCRRKDSDLDSYHRQRCRQPTKCSAFRIPVSERRRRPHHHIPLKLISIQFFFFCKFHVAMQSWPHRAKSPLCRRTDGLNIWPPHVQKHPLAVSSTHSHRSCIDAMRISLSMDALRIFASMVIGCTMCPIVRTQIRNYYGIE